MTIKKTLKSQLFSAIIMLIIATVVFTSASYAWFTQITTTQVENINLYVTASDAMELSALESPVINYADDWLISMTREEITAPDRGNQTDAFPAEMLNVSSCFNGTSSDFYTAAYTNTGDVTGFSSVPQKNNYAKFSLWVKSTRSGFIFLDRTSLVNALLAATAPNNSIKETIRIGFVPIDYDANGADDGGMISGEAWDYAVIWEPNSTIHLAAAYGGPGGSTKLTTNSTFGTNAANTSTQITYDFSLAAGSNTTNINAANVFDGTLTDTTAIVPDPERKIALFNMSYDTMQRFNIYIWVEGADADTQNSVAKSTFTTALKFGQEYEKYLGDEYKAP